MGILSHNPGISQDLIQKKSGDEIKSQVIEVGLKDISYKKYENLNGPVYKILQSEVTKIIYENGTMDVFDNNQITKMNALPAVKPAQKEAESNVPFKSYFSGGFNLMMHNGMYGSTVPARPDGGSYNPHGSDKYTGLGFGVKIDYRIIELIALSFDINNYTSTTPVAEAGGYASSDWVWRMNDYDTRLIGPFPNDAYYNITTTGFRLGLKIYPMKKEQIQPWYGIYYGYYAVNLGIYTKDEKSHWGSSDLNTGGLTFMNFGVDFWNKTKSFGGTGFLELGSPVVRNYLIENCLHTGWTFEDFGEGTHIFGYTRVGISLNFTSARKY
jgi:hypothetical protein